MSATSEQDKPDHEDKPGDSRGPAQDLREMKDELTAAGFDPPNDEPPDEDDDTEGEPDDSDDASCQKDLNNALSQARAMYAHESKRAEVLREILDGLCPGICQPIEADAVEVSQNGVTDNVAFAREQAVIAIYRAIRQIAKRSDLVVYASHIFALGCVPKFDKNTQGSAK